MLNKQRAFSLNTLLNTFNTLNTNSGSFILVTKTIYVDPNSLCIKDRACYSLFFLLYPSELRAELNLTLYFVYLTHSALVLKLHIKYVNYVNNKKVRQKRQKLKWKQQQSGACSGASGSRSSGFPWWRRLRTELEADSHGILISSSNVVTCCFQRPQVAKIILKVEIKVKNINIANSFVQKCVVPNSLQCYLFIWAWISPGSSLYDCFLQVCDNYWFVLCSELFISGHTHKSVSYLPLQSWQRWTTMNETFQSSRRHKRGSLTWPNFFSLLGFLHKHMKESARKMNNASIFLYLLCQGPAVSPPYPENSILTRCWRAKLHVYHIITFLSPVSHHFFLMYVCVCMDTERHQGRSYFLVFIWINYIDLSHFFFFTSSIQS